MHKEFEIHTLNDKGKENAKYIAGAFDGLLIFLEHLIQEESREMAIARTRLEEACFFANKAMTIRPENQV